MFVGKDFRLGSTGMVEHEIHTCGPPIRQPFRRQNPEIRRQEQEQLKEMLDEGIGYSGPHLVPGHHLWRWLKKKMGLFAFASTSGS